MINHCSLVELIQFCKSPGATMMLHYSIRPVGKSLAAQGFISLRIAVDVPPCFYQRR